MRLTQQQLEAHLWGAANILRGKTAGQDYKNYILSLMFYKRLCDVWDEEFEVLLAATGDPQLAQWLEKGTIPDDVPIDRLPPEIPPSALARDLSAAERQRVAQRRLLARTSARALGPCPWPRRLGTPPWTAAT